MPSLTRMCNASLVILLLGAAIDSTAYAGEWDARLSAVMKDSEQEIRSALAAGKRDEAKESIRQRDRRLLATLEEFIAAGESNVPPDDLRKIAECYELVGRWDEAVRYGKQYVAANPDSEAVQMLIFRSLLNLRRIEEAAEHLAEVEGTFSETSPIRFVHSMIASTCETRKQWSDVLRHSVIAADRRVALVQAHPELAIPAIDDFRRIATAAVAMEQPEAGREPLSRLSKALEESLAQLQRQPESNGKFARECLQRKLKCDIAYWLGATEVGPAFAQWVDTVIRSWSSPAISHAASRRQARGITTYILNHGGTLTPEMIDSLSRLKAHVDGLLAADHRDDGQLKQISSRCQMAIDGQVFGGRQRRRYGGI